MSVGDWFGRWFGDWFGSPSADDGSIAGTSAQTLAGVDVVSAGMLLVAGASVAEVASTLGEASGALPIAGTSVATLGDAVAPVAQPQPVRPVGVGWYVGTWRRAPIAGRSAVTLDDVSSTRPAVPRTERQRKGRRDDEYLLGMVAGWR